MTIPKPRERVAVCYESTMRGYLELRVRSYDSKDTDVAKLFASEHVYVREDVAAAETTALRRERDALQRRVDALREGLRVIVMRSLASVDDPNVEVMAYEIADHALVLDSDMATEGEDDEAAKGVG